MAAEYITDFRDRVQVKAVSAALAGLLLFLFGLASPARAYMMASSSSKPELGLGVRYNSIAEDVFETGLESDYYSYVVSLRHSMNSGTNTEFSVDYYSGEGDVEQIIRPSLAFLWGGDMHFGTGASMAYVRHAETGGEWSDLVYQVQGGVRFPLGRSLKLNLDAFYFMQSLGDIGDIRFDNLTFSARIFFSY